MVMELLWFGFEVLLIIIFSPLEFPKKNQENKEVCGSDLFKAVRILHTQNGSALPRGSGARQSIQTNSRTNALERCLKVSVDFQDGNLPQVPEFRCKTFTLVFSPRSSRLDLWFSWGKRHHLSWTLRTFLKSSKTSPTRGTKTTRVMFQLKLYCCPRDHGASWK